MNKDRCRPGTTRTATLVPRHSDFAASACGKVTTSSSGKVTHLLAVCSGWHRSRSLSRSTLRRASSSGSSQAIGPTRYASWMLTSGTGSRNIAASALPGSRRSVGAACAARLPHLLAQRLLDDAFRLGRPRNLKPLDHQLGELASPPPRRTRSSRRVRSSGEAG